MRKLILAGAIVATVLPVAAQAQYATPRQEMRHERREVRREVRHERQDMRRDRVAYVAPYRGWRYQPVTTGYQLRPGFYGQRYMISDYGRYHLTAPRPNLRWVRYGNDLVLVNVRNGRVREVRRNVAW